MFHLYNFIFQRLIWKEISFYFLRFDYWIFKEWKTAIVQNHCLIKLTIYTNDWSPFWHVYCYHVYFFLCEIAKYVQAKNRLAHLNCYFMEWASMLTKLAGYDEYRLARFHLIRNLLANKIYHFPGCPIKQASFLPGQPTPCNQLLIWPLLLVPECYLHKMLKLAFWNFNPIFLRI